MTFMTTELLIDNRPCMVYAMPEPRCLVLTTLVWHNGGERFYVEKVAFKDWHVCIHAFYLISDKLAEGHTVVEQRWNYDDFCNITVRLEEYTYLLIRQVDAVALVRSFRPIPIDEFDNIAQPLL